MKTVLLLSTIWFSLVSLDLPNVNSAPVSGSKLIKAAEISLANIPFTDTSALHVAPAFHLAKPGNYHIKTVVIDPGHGGHDPGCLGGHSREKHLALAIGKYLADGMRSQFPGLKVIMTRSTDVFIPLHERASIATRNKADLFISIHCNAFPTSHASGIETYVLGLHATEENLAVAKRENASILLEDNYKENYGYDPNSPEAHIMFSMFQNAFLEQSISFAEKVQGRLTALPGRHDRGVKQAGFLVLRHATMPSVLVETGFLTNSRDEDFLLSESGQRKTANAILNAFIEYKADMEGNGERAATVAYVEAPNKNSMSSGPSHKFFKKEAKKAQPVVAKPKPRWEKEAEVAKKKGLEIGMPSPPPPPKPASSPVAKTNTSPRHSSKIMATPPINTDIKPTSFASANKETPAKDHIIFCVQLAASPSRLNVSSGKWSRLDQSVEVVKEGSLYKYQVRNFATLNSANEAKTKLRAKGFRDAFVIAYKNGERIDPRKLKLRN
ncbi:MAG TPA: N-acetylmuramoyl-L-alanine amidase [Bacteroidetes bacterium]|nr:N-acetylmuramoyl-L-alanine amidase [Bacteroidota bacterium]